MHEHLFRPYSAASACGRFAAGTPVSEHLLANVVVTLLLLERTGPA